ncbi:hypothetical protein [uncultured Jatrophihabitans sp.]|uniref:hypothetical protein n=1 Tax=uncultured Jatrophihabitans sp. TaxID=1610747 RepID=UPI0035C97975
MTAPQTPGSEPALAAGLAGADLAIRGGATSEELAVLLAVVTQLTALTPPRDPYLIWRDTRRAAMRVPAMRLAAANGSDSLSW